MGWGEIEACRRDDDRITQAIESVDRVLSWGSMASEYLFTWRRSVGFFKRW